MFQIAWSRARATVRTWLLYDVPRRRKRPVLIAQIIEQPVRSTSLTQVWESRLRGLQPPACVAANRPNTGTREPPTSSPTSLKHKIKPAAPIQRTLTVQTPPPLLLLSPFTRSLSLSVPALLDSMRSSRCPWGRRGALAARPSIVSMVALFSQFIFNPGKILMSLGKRSWKLEKECLHYSISNSESGLEFGLGLGFELS